MVGQLFLLILCPLAMSVSMLLLYIHIYITQLCLLNNVLQLLIRPSLVELKFIQCIQIAFGHVSSLPAVVARWSAVLNNILLVYLSSMWKFPEGSEGLQYLETILNILFQLQDNCHRFLKGLIGYCLCLCFDKSFQTWF